jgi:hypothetical protein
MFFKDSERNPSLTTPLSNCQTYNARSYDENWSRSSENRVLGHDLS